jgi:hypothetical protein
MQLIWEHPLKPHQSMNLKTITIMITTMEVVAASANHQQFKLKEMANLLPLASKMFKPEIRFSYLMETHQPSNAWSELKNQ